MLSDALLKNAGPIFRRNKVYLYMANTYYVLKAHIVENCEIKSVYKKNMGFWHTNKMSKVELVFLAIFILFYIS